MSDEELDVTEVVLRDGWAVVNPITKIDMEFLASADDAITVLRAQHDAANARADRAEAALAAQIEADAGLIDLIADAATGVLLGSAQDHAVLDMMKSLSAAIRAQPHSTTTLDRVKAQVRADAIREFEQSRANGERVQLGDDGKLDEIVSCGTAHLEHMGGQSWFLSMGFADGSEHCVWFRGKVTMEERREPPALLDKDGA